MYACMLIICVVVFSTIDSNDECAKEGEVFEYQEEGDQGQATQGKPSTCYISESYHYPLHCLTPVSLVMHSFFFYIAIIL
jgi:hypothetical protein